ncbi:MAG: molecular chaperone TorD family protein [Chloroflexi bacterium]|nr:molecular chaperone TorD family protein [Dehalococcoidia bacterium]MCO5200666.1 molecular chaperone TorD family protein [Chloroflexota bacterium]MCZ7578307.1 molecular chaperone TorD family protein [Dehalococcoidia bacterium]
MATATAHRPPIDMLAMRSAGYSLLAHAFAYPDADRVGAIRDAGAEFAAVGLQSPLNGLAHMALAATTDGLEREYVRLCSLSSSPDCPGFETAYFSADATQQTARMADLAGFYRAFGVDATSGGVRPDDLPVELEFMSFLCQKEAYAKDHLGAPRVKQSARAQRMFLEEHLGRWGAPFGRRIAARAVPGHFYHVAGLALAEWISGECALLRIRPDEVSGEPAVGWGQPISHGPEFAGPAKLVPLEDIEVQ